MKFQILATCLFLLPTVISIPVPQVGAVGSTTDSTLLDTLALQTDELSTLARTNLVEVQILNANVCFVHGSQNFTSQ